jgi:hypothetical protein
MITTTFASNSQSVTATLEDLATLSPIDFARRRDELIKALIETFNNPNNGYILQSHIDDIRWSSGGGVKAARRMLEEIDELLDASLSGAHRLRELSES